MLLRYLKNNGAINLSKFNGVVMLGGVTLNGQQIYLKVYQYRKTRN